MFKSNRVLFINSFSGYELPNYKKILSLADIHNILERYASLEAPADLTLDLRGLSDKVMSSLLVFLETYLGKVILIVDDPVLPTILSRFIEIIKFPVINPDFTITDLQINARVSKSTKEKLKVLL